jgi:hypothetical protein
MFETFLFVSLAFGSSFLDGTWMRSCQGGKITYEIFRKDEAILREDFYADTDCQTASIRFESTGKFFLSANPIFMDFYFQKVEITPLSKQVAEDFSNRQVCGLSSWSEKLPIKVTGLNCQLFGAKPIAIPQLGEARFGIYKIEDSRLYFGQNDPFYHGRTVERRPITWDHRFYQSVSY